MCMPSQTSSQSDPIKMLSDFVTYATDANTSVDSVLSNATVAATIQAVVSVTPPCRMLYNLIIGVILMIVAAIGATGQ